MHSFACKIFFKYYLAFYCKHSDVLCYCGCNGIVKNIKKKVHSRKKRKEKRMQETAGWKNQREILCWEKKCTENCLRKKICCPVKKSKNKTKLCKSQWPMITPWWWSKLATCQPSTDVMHEPISNQFLWASRMKSNSHQHKKRSSTSQDPCSKFVSFLMSVTEVGVQVLCCCHF